MYTNKCLRASQPLGFRKRPGQGRARLLTVLEPALRRWGSNNAGIVGRVPVWWFQRLREFGSGVLARDVLIVLAAHASKKTDTAYPKIETIADVLRVKPHAVKMAIAELKPTGIIKVTARNRRKRESNLYELSYERPFPVAGPATQRQTDHVADLAIQKNNEIPENSGKDPEELRKITRSSCQIDRIRLPIQFGMSCRFVRNRRP